MAANFYMKTFSYFTKYRLFVWPIVVIVSVAGFFYPKMGLIILPMFAVIMVMGFFKGRFWCGNICPRGAFMDIPARKIGKFGEIKKLFRNKYFRFAVLILLMGMFTKNTVKAFGAWGSASFLDKLGMAGVMMCAVTTSIGLILALMINPRSWCTFCPMGTVQKFLHKIRKKVIPKFRFNKKITMTAPSACVKCGQCSRVCPMQLNVHDKALNSVYQVDDLDCIKCKTCVNHCKTGILKFEKEIHPHDFILPAVKKGFEKRRQFESVISKIKTLAEGVKEFTFKTLDGSAFSFTSGQFIAIKVDNDKNIFRAYSISKPSENKDEVSITIKLDKKGYATPKIFELKEGDKILIEGPMGDFTIKDDNTNKLFVAGGIGITPFLSLVKDALKSKSRGNINLLYGSNTSEDIIYSEYFKELKAKHENFDYSVVILNPDKDWKGHTGYVTDLIKDLDLENTKAYLCGPGAMIDATVKSLKNKGLNEEAIHIDLF